MSATAPRALVVAGRYGTTAQIATAPARAPDGDPRDWNAVRRWGGETAGQIAPFGEPPTLGT